VPLLSLGIGGWSYRTPDFAGWPRMIAKVLDRKPGPVRAVVTLAGVRHWSLRSRAHLWPTMVFHSSESERLSVVFGEQVAKKDAGPRMARRLFQADMESLLDNYTPSGAGVFLPAL